jgi:spore coat protein U-like protein
VPGTYNDTISSASISFTVIAVVTATCTISATALNFGNYSGALINAASALTVICTLELKYKEQMIVIPKHIAHWCPNSNNGTTGVRLLALD